MRAHLVFQVAAKFGLLDRLPHIGSGYLAFRGGGDGFLPDFALVLGLDAGQLAGLLLGGRQVRTRVLTSDIVNDVSCGNEAMSVATGYVPPILAVFVK